MSDALPELAYVEHALPGSQAERLAFARRLDLALEVAHRPGTDLEAIRRSGLRVVTVQAWRLHEVHPLHPDPKVRAQAGAVVEQAMLAALRLGAPRVLTVCGFGSEVCDAPLERCLEFFAALAHPARERGLRLLIELLSPRRAAVMSAPGDLRRLLDGLDDPAAFSAALDTGHLLDAGLDPLEVLRAWRRPLEELQLRGAASTAPGAELPLESWLAARSTTPAVVAVEHREALPEARCEALVRRLRGALP